MRALTVRSTKYDNSSHWHYKALLLEAGDWGWLSFQKPGQSVEGRNGNWFTRYHSLRWHWRDCWWDALLLFDDEGHWLEWYCNIVTPPRLVDGVLRFHDLDLDVVWHREHGIRIVDTDEFERHAVQMRYPSSLIQQAWETAQEVKRMMQQGAWRFGTDPQSIRFEQEMARWNALLT